MIRDLTTVQLKKVDLFPGEVIKDRLYIGGVGTAYSLETLQKFGITHILTVAHDIKPCFRD